MDKMKEKTPYFEFGNNVNQNNEPIGYPDLSGMLPSSYPKLNPPTRVIKYHEGPMSHSINPERPSKMKMAQQSELKLMKLVK